jgi:hypothetical protein
MQGEKKMIEKLTIVSVLTATFTEAIKKVLDEMGFRYATNVLAAIVSAFVSAVVELYPLLSSGAEIGLNHAYELIALICLSFISSTLGYDKVIQMLDQIKKG